MTGELLHVADISTSLKADPSLQIIMGSSRQTEDASNLDRPFGKFDRSPTMKQPRVSGKPFNKDKMLLLWMQRIWPHAKRLSRTKQTTQRRPSRPQEV